MKPGSRMALLGGLTAVVLATWLTLRSGNSSITEQTRPSTSSSPDLRAITDSAPYWCDLVPKKALQQISGISDPLVETRDGRGPKQGSCMVTGQSPVYPLGVELHDIGTRAIIDRQLNAWQSHNPKLLPNNLGYGLAAHVSRSVDGRPYIVSSVFRCGSKQPLIYLEIDNVWKGRDYLADLTELMRIAEKRYGVSRKCTPGPLK